ncbi:uncharacterized protein DUF4244 [Motilibacter rhizosphaerae]|uniref:Uncharacterized protein DUF4244 n=1 Tax=Motilibacter rhizosphaerae TaxID=598652 RepID=A0A4Q7NAB5_9ACTN|nr:DUF4244 domain-containing protein [Motilibacter rhizosphaerae]RZS79391.1 uncharacterized protein DUF4244 [Motilibacter rhizosphaerae]
MPVPRPRRLPVVLLLLGARARRLARMSRTGGSGDAGMTTAEYAVGTLAACGFAALLLKVLTSATVAGLLSGLVARALAVAG